MALGQHGAHGNIWLNRSADGDEHSSDAFDMHLGNEAHIFGEAAGAYRVRVQYSQDGQRWYNGESVEVDEDGHFNIKLSGVQARYVRLQALRAPEFKPYEDAEESDEPMRLNATLAAKTTR